MKGTMKQITWANEIVEKLEKANAIVTDKKSKFLLDTVITCCKAENVYAGDVIELFAQSVRESTDRIAPTAAAYMRRFENDLRNSIYAAATK